jgi:hypothetical protein
VMTVNTHEGVANASIVFKVQKSKSGPVLLKAQVSRLHAHGLIGRDGSVGNEPVPMGVMVKELRNKIKSSWHFFKPHARRVRQNTVRNLSKEKPGQLPLAAWYVFENERV